VPKAEIATADSTGRSLGRVDGAALIEGDSDSAPVHDAG
jgi:hypothetical protein